jgi:hypothetical protein
MIATATASVATAAQLVLITIFLWAALSKARAPEGSRATMLQLGLTPALTRLAAPTLVATEFICALGLALAPATWWPRALVAALAISFSAAGLVAVATRRRISCNCFGSVGSTRLGWRQVFLMPVWLGLAAIAQWQHPIWSLQQALLILASLLLALVAIHLPRELRILRTLQGDRLAILSTYRKHGATTSHRDRELV